MYEKGKNFRSVFKNQPQKRAIFGEKFIQDRKLFIHVPHGINAIYGQMWHIFINNAIYRGENMCSPISGLFFYKLTMRNFNL